MTAREDLHTAQSGLIDAISQVKVRETLFEAAKLQAEIARRQYSLGLVTFLDWDQTENALIDAERSLLASRRDAVLALATWERARGQRLSDLRGQELSDP
jgi:outer membrane protein TolC